MKSLMLTFAALMLLLIGCTSNEPRSLGMDPEKVEETREAIQSVVPDTVRATKMVAVLDEFAAEAKSLAQDAEAIQQKIVEANRDYATTRAQLEELYNDRVQVTQQLGDCIRDHSLRLRALCSEDEWNRIIDEIGDDVEFNF